MSRMLTAALVAVSALLFVSAAAQALPIVSVDADPNTAGIQSTINIQNGDSFDVDIVISGVDAASPLNGFEFDLFFDPVRLAATGVVDGGFLSAPVISIQNVIGAMSVEFAEVSLGAIGASGSGTLATISFVAQGAGDSLLDLQNVLLSAPFGVQIAGAVNDGSVGVVPEPTGAMLFAVGFLVASRRRIAGGR